MHAWLWVIFVLAHVDSIAMRPLTFITPCKRRVFPILSSVRPHILGSTTSLHQQSSSANENYYTTASSFSTSDKTTYPKWWLDGDSSEEQTKYMKFADHIAHVIVPNITNDTLEDIDDDDDDDAQLTVKDVIQWVLSERNKRQSLSNDQESTSSIIPTSLQLPTEHDIRQLQIQHEWNEGEEVSTSLKILDPGYRHDTTLFHQDYMYNDKNTHNHTNLIAVELLALGSVWYLPSLSASSAIDRFDPSSGIKPTRINVGDTNRTVQTGDYFRIHFDPRRFVDSNLYDWGTADGIMNETSRKPGVIVARDDDAGYIIINKPPNIPVHARVDNLLENVASSIGRMLWLERQAYPTNGVDDEDTSVIVNDEYNNHTRRRRKQRKQKVEPLVYVATPQRLDQNTSGLLVVGTKKTFAAYFAKLLRTKTSGQILENGISSQYTSSCGVHKAYKCLVCISPRSEISESLATASMASEIDRLKGYTNTIMRHYLEPSIRAPKRFERVVPNDVDNVESWAECLLRITNVTAICTVVGNVPSNTLGKSLWGEYGKPDGTIAIAECEIELLTGRTHQIRGQLAAEGFPLVGDVQYEGAVPNTSSLWKERCKGRAESFLDSERLALQCCSLDFLDPDHLVTSDGLEKKKAKRSERWNSFRLDNSFWSPFISKFVSDSANLSEGEVTSSLEDEATLLSQAKCMEPKPDASPTQHSLPPRVLLSQGSNKYVVIKAWGAGGGDNTERLFVRSSTPAECNGPYHANVAKKVLHQLKALGYTTEVMGGGRIDYIESEDVKHARVFGFSYGFGKGDHEKVASIIEKYSDVIATFDNSDGLY